MEHLKTSIQVLEMTPGTEVLMEMTNEEIIDLTVIENFNPVRNEKIEKMYGDYLITYLN